VATLANDRESEGYIGTEDSRSAASSALKVGLISAASAIVGGLAAAWWYRKTLSKLQNPIVDEGQNETQIGGQGVENSASEDDDLPHLIND
jgi:hypothetical protein